MLSPWRPWPGQRGQRGFVMIIALIALAIMSIAAIGLMRTTSASASIAGNLAFEQAAATSADQAVEAAVTWLENNSGQTSSSTATTCSTGTSVLACDQTSRGYAATRTDPSSTQSWSQLWTQLVSAGYTAVSQSQDSSGNTASYLIQRMCASTGDASSANGCGSSPLAVNTGGSKKSGSTQSSSSQVYYRITVKVSGPRNTVSFTQAMVAL